MISVRGDTQPLLFGRSTATKKIGGVVFLNLLPFDMRYFDCWNFNPHFRLNESSVIYNICIIL